MFFYINRVILAYGNTTTIQNLAYGGTKSSTPSIVNAANDIATSLINQFLNLTEDISSPSTTVINAANIIAVEYVKNPRIEMTKLYETAKVLLGEFRDNLIPSESGDPVHLEFVQ